MGLHDIYELTRRIFGVEFRLSIEVGILDSFFSSTHPARGSGKIYGQHDSAEGRELVVKYPNTSLTVTDKFKSNKRETKFKIDSDGLYMDMVQRWVVRKEDVCCWDVGGERIYHRRKNFYYQFACSSLTMVGKDGCIRFEPLVTINSTKLSPLIYVRDEPDCWIFHVRLLSEEPDVITVKGCSKFYSKVFPKFIRQFLKRYGLDKRLLYVRERISQRIPFQAQGANYLSKGDTVAIVTEMKDD